MENTPPEDMQRLITPILRRSATPIPRLHRLRIGQKPMPKNSVPQKLIPIRKPIL